MKDGTLSSLVLAGCVTVAGWMGYGMIHGQDDTPKDLTALVVDDEAREMSPTLYSVDKHAHQVDLGDDNTPIRLREGDNVLELECHAYNSDTQVYTMSGAGGNVTEGQTADIFGNGGDVTVQKTNGETVEVQLHCAGGKYGYDHVQAIINVER